MNREQQAHYNKRLTDELFKMEMSWDNQLEEWYPIALKALDFASPLSTGVPQKDFYKLFETTAHGLTMNVVMVLCNNMEARTPAEMQIPGQQWAQWLRVNASIGKRWNELSLPVQKTILKEVEILGGKPVIQLAQA